MSALVLRHAKLRVKNFEDESSHFTELHRDTLECRDCEAVLQLGIDAFHWLVKADETFRALILSEEAEYDSQVEQAIEVLFRQWLAPADFANQWILAAVEGRGLQCDNLEAFRKCEAEVRAIVRFLDRDELTDPARSARDEALAEHNHGQTAEFI